MALGNECIPFYEVADRLTGHCSGAVIGKRFVKVVTPGFQVGGSPGLAGPPQGTGTGGEGGNLIISQTSVAGEFADGVAFYDCADTKKIGAFSINSGFIVPVTAGEALAFGDLVMAGTTGKAMKATVGSKQVLGRVVQAASGDGVDAAIRLFYGGLTAAS